MKLQIRGKILQTFWTFIPRRKSGLQMKTTKEVENSRHFSRVTIGAKYYRKRASG